MEFDFNALLAMISTFMDAPTWKAIIMCIGIVLICILYIAKYFFDKNKRESEAYEFSLKIRKEQEANLLKLQIDSSQALIDNMDINNKLNYDYFVQQLKKDNHKAIYYKVHASLHEKVSDFLYNEKLTPEQKSALVVKLMNTK